MCIPDEFTLCATSEECEAGEICATVSGVILEDGVCLSEGAVAVTDGVSPVPAVVSEICIDAEALRHMPREELVFSEHVMGRVLCDSEGSCATYGHIVVYHGRAMMMGTYCEMVGCTGRAKHVNSPKYSRRRRVQSRTEGLEYTAFAARWETKVEERVLTAAVRIGL